VQRLRPGDSVSHIVEQPGFAKTHQQRLDQRCRNRNGVGRTPTDAPHQHPSQIFGGTGIAREIVEGPALKEIGVYVAIFHPLIPTAGSQSDIVLRPLQVSTQTATKPLTTEHPRLSETSHPSSTTREPRLRILIPLVIGCAFFMEGLDSTMIAVAIPDMAKSLGESPLRLNLVIASYLLSLAVFIPVSGWIADRLGARIVFCSAIAIFAAGSVLCGLSESLPVLLGMRVLQGFGGAMMTPVGRLILLRSFPRSGLVSAMNWMTIPAMIGPTVGPIIGGFLTTYFSWRAIFYLKLPIGIAGVGLSLWLIEDFRAPAPTRFDLRGFFIVGAGLALLELAIENVGRPMIPGPVGALIFAIALAMLLFYFWHARRCEDPVLDLRLLRIRTFRIGTVTGSICRMGLDAVPFLLPLLFQVGFGLSPLQAGLLSFSSSLGAMLVRTLSGTFLRFFGFRRLLAGNAVLAAAVTAACGLLQPSTPAWLVVS
jgi:EmrB/QacA subfamily drug resistance transporter